MQPRRGTMRIGGAELEYAWFGPQPGERPTLVLLHEGLGCVAMWRGFPQALSEATGCGVLVYSRQGYGGSSPVPLPRPLSYMHDEAFNVVGRILDDRNITRAILVGHSDGASIAAIYAGGVADARVRALVLMAPHFFVEDVSVESIAEARTAYETGDLRARLERHHGANVDCAFRGWNEAWLDPGFRAWDITEYLPSIRVPVLIVQGESDEYGTTAQPRAAEQECMCPVEVALLPDCGHAPFRDQSEKTLAAVAGFVTHVIALENDAADAGA